MRVFNKRLVLFFSYGVSLESWKMSGIIGREIKYYNYLAQHFKKIYFITYGMKSELKFKDMLAENIEILPKCNYLPSSIYQFLIPLIYRAELVRSDVYKTNQMSASMPAILAKWIYKKRLVVRCGYEWLFFLVCRKIMPLKIILAYFFEKIVYLTADKIILTSFYDKQYIEQKFRVKTSKVEVIPNCIDTDLFKYQNVLKEENSIIFVGRLETEKNIANLLEALSGLNLKLRIFGEGSLESDLKEKAESLNLKVEFHGVVSNERLLKEMNKSELFILPSLYEGNPKVLLEAMACGLPCIGTDVKGIAEIIEHKRNGWLCECDGESIRTAILNIMKDKNFRREIGQNAAKTIIENFSLKTILKKEVKVYNML